jgi:bifunctional oligoribonuclease and PAP phosphatase NrnA
MNNSTFAEIASALEGAEEILIASHQRPDGDALGSTLAVALWLRSLGKKVTTWNEDGMPEKFHYLPWHQMVTVPASSPRAFDVVVALDNAVKNRLGTVWNGVGASALLINIDHHVTNQGYGDLNHVDPSAPATGQILYEFFLDRDIEITSDMATCLFAAISTDTGSFQYEGTNQRTFAAASALVGAGVDVAGLSRALYEDYPRRRLELLRHALNAAKFTCDDRVASFSLSLEKVKELGVIPEDNEGLIDHLRAVEGVVAAVFFEELEDGKVRVSARSKDPRVNVSEICGQFGGGGHPLAAGARIAGSLVEVETNFLEAICHAIK